MFAMFEGKNMTSAPVYSWWCHQMETFSTLLALCVENSPVIGEFPSWRPLTWSFDIFFDLRLNKCLSKQLRCRWLERPSHSLWRHCNVLWSFRHHYIVMDKIFSWIFRFSCKEEHVIIVSIFISPHNLIESMCCIGIFYKDNMYHITGPTSNFTILRKKILISWSGNMKHHSDMEEKYSSHPKYIQ